MNSISDEFDRERPPAAVILCSCFGHILHNSGYGCRTCLDCRIFSNWGLCFSGKLVAGRNFRPFPPCGEKLRKILKYISENYSTMQKSGPSGSETRTVYERANGLARSKVHPRANPIIRRGLAIGLALLAETIDIDFINVKTGSGLFIHT